MDIETKKASLDTLSVTIQALHVNGKQMTLAVFRQLPITEAFGVTGELSESLDPWGLVRYAIKKQGDYWLVASRDGKLFRCLFALKYWVDSKAIRENINFEINKHNEKAAPQELPWNWKYLTDEAKIERQTSLQKELTALKISISGGKERFNLAVKAEKIYTDLEKTLPHLFIAV